MERRYSTASNSVSATKIARETPGSWGLSIQRRIFVARSLVAGTLFSFRDLAEIGEKMANFLKVDHSVQQLVRPQRNNLSHLLLFGTGLHLAGMCVVPQKFLFHRHILGVDSSR
jgi:hypothetical protein